MKTLTFVKREIEAEKCKVIICSIPSLAQGFELVEQLDNGQNEVASLRQKLGRTVYYQALDFMYWMNGVVDQFFSMATNHNGSRGAPKQVMRLNNGSCQLIKTEDGYVIVIGR